MANAGAGEAARVSAASAAAALWPKLAEDSSEEPEAFATTGAVGRAAKHRARVGATRA